MRITLISLTGLRVYEACDLRWSNIDLDNGIIHVCEQVINDKTNKKFINTDSLNTVKSYRDISISKFLVSILKSHKLKQPFSNKDFVILDIHTKMYNPRNLSMNFTKVLNKYKLIIDSTTANTKDKIKLYQQLHQISIRGFHHTHATILLLNGENVKVISERLEHNSIKITMDTYSHVLPSMKRQTSDLLDDVFDVL